MKRLYTLLLTLSACVGGYFIAKSFSFDNTLISVALANILLLLIPLVLLAIIVAVVISLKRKHYDKDVMTIRQYYQYKSAR